MILYTHFTLNIIRWFTFMLKSTTLHKRMLTDSFLVQTSFSPAISFFQLLSTSFQLAEHSVSDSKTPNHQILPTWWLTSWLQIGTTSSTRRGGVCSSAQHLPLDLPTETAGKVAHSELVVRDSLLDSQPAPPLAVRPPTAGRPGEELWTEGPCECWRGDAWIQETWMSMLQASPLEYRSSPQL